MQRHVLVILGLEVLGIYLVCKSVSIDLLSGPCRPVYPQTLAYLTHFSELPFKNRIWWERWFPALSFFIWNVLFADDAVKAQHEAGRSALVGDVGKVEAGALQAYVKVSLGQPLKHRPEVAERWKIKLIDGKDIPNVKLWGTHLTSGNRGEGGRARSVNRNIDLGLLGSLCWTRCVGLHMDDCCNDIPEAHHWKCGLCMSPITWTQCGRFHGQLWRLECLSLSQGDIFWVWLAGRILLSCVGHTS